MPFLKGIVISGEHATPPWGGYNLYGYGLYQQIRILFPYIDCKSIILLICRNIVEVHIFINMYLIIVNKEISLASCKLVRNFFFLICHFKIFNCIARKMFNVLES